MSLLRHGRRTTAAALSLLVIAATAQASMAVADPTITSITIAGDLDSEIGCSGDWQPDCAAAHLTLDTASGWWVGSFALPAGSYQYKAAENDSWSNPNYGPNAGSGNGTVVVPAGGEKVTFVFDPVSHQLGDSASIASAVGSFQTQLGCATNGSPLCYQSWLRDNTGSGVLTLATGAIAAGTYDLSVVVGFGLPGTTTYPRTFTVPEVGGGSTTTITYTEATHAITVTSVPLVQAAPGVFSHPTASRGDVVANLFEWNWPSVANECATVLGPAGYGGVQVAPPENSISNSPSNPGTNHPWWDVYQPVDYSLNSRMGSEVQFKSMVASCRKAGVKVYVDAVINHMTGQGTTSYGGNDSFTKYNYPGLYTQADFHNYPQDCPLAGDTIVDFNNVTQVQKCELVGLSDLRTESDYVRTQIAGYLNKMLSYGVSGFRVDAAKHIGQADLAAIEAKLHRTVDGTKPYIAMEVGPGGPGVLSPFAFEGQGSLLGFDFADAVKAAFNSNISDFSVFGEASGLLPSNKTLAFITNHDTERDGSTLNYKNGAEYTLANEFMLAYGYGKPEVYAGFAFAGHDDGPPSNAGGFVANADCTGNWVCTDRSRGIANLVDWHNYAGNAPVRNFYADGVNLISFSRGDRAFIAINNEATAQTHTFTTGLRAGVYCDVVHGTFSLDRRGSNCSGPTVTVARGGQATITVPALDSVAFDAGNLTRR